MPQRHRHIRDQIMQRLPFDPTGPKAAFMGQIRHTMILPKLATSGVMSAAAAGVVRTVTDD